MHRKLIAASAAAAVAACAAWPAAASAAEAVAVDVAQRGGTVAVTVGNQSQERLGSVVVGVAASDGASVADGGRESRAAVGPLSPGESATVEFAYEASRPAVLLATASADGRAAAAKGVAAEPSAAAFAEQGGFGALSAGRAAEPSLSVEQTTDLPEGGKAAVGDTVRVVVKVRNAGPGDAADVLVRSIVPKGTSVVEGSVTEGGAPGSDGRFVEWTVPAIAAGSWAEMSYEAAVVSAEGSVSSQASCENGASGKAGAGTTLATVSSPVVIETVTPADAAGATASPIAEAPRDEPALAGSRMPKTGDPWAATALVAGAAAASAAVGIAAARRAARGKGPGKAL